MNEYCKTHLAISVRATTPEELIRKIAIASVVLKFELKVAVHLIAIQQNVVELIVQAIAIGNLIQWSKIKKRNRGKYEIKKTAS